VCIDIDANNDPVGFDVSCKMIENLKAEAPHYSATRGTKMENNETAEKKDPIKIHREGTALSDSGEYEEATEKFLEASKLYEKRGNIFDASYTLYKAAECSYTLKDYDTASERFLKAAELAFERGYDRFGVSALEYARDCYKATGEEKKIEELEKRIKEAKEKLSTF
jgi:tetratricopeptide (TPR) repeat protein